MKTMAYARRSKSAGSRLSQKFSVINEADDPNSYNVRFDYSHTYLDNEDLDLRLEDQALELHRERYRAGVETDELLKKAKQDADEKLQLKNKIKNRDPNESSNRVLKSAELKRRPSKLVCDKQFVENASKTPTNEQTPEKDSTTENLMGEENEKLDEPRQPKCINNLTMFLLSVHTFKKNITQKKDDKNVTEKKNIFDSDSKEKKVPSHKKKPPQLLPKRPSSYHLGDTRSRSQSLPIGNEDDKSQYGMHVRTDFTRSRRRLEEISRLEQDSKYGYVNKYEERRKKLLAQCKDTQTLDGRIKSFLHEIDEFKVLSSAENSLEKVLMRSKQNRLQRSNTFAW
ncbi:uncharacterized protein LOC128238367 [Mya arenaria]|uniref:uncharacterized protein LOC128238367 n=1 Tax=Mya arenaria TaxID=6604 RepID=UPI0022E0ACB1|nr:uncharacterized protein LOC128238367 [Mya arenaria]